MRRVSTAISRSRGMLGTLICALCLATPVVAAPLDLAPTSPTSPDAVAQAQAEIDALVLQREDAIAALQTAAEDYNEAQYYLDQALAKQQDLNQQLRVARDKLAASQRELKKYAVQKDRGGSGFSAIEPLVRPEGFTQLVQRHGANQVLGNKVSRALETNQVDARYVQILERNQSELTAQIQEQTQSAKVKQERAAKVERESSQAVQRAYQRRDELIKLIAAQTRRDAAAVQREQDEREEAGIGQPGAGTNPHPAPTPTPQTPSPAPSTPAAPSPSPTPTNSVAPEPSTPAQTTPPATTPPATTPPTTTPPAPAPDTGDLGKGTAKGTAAQGEAALAWAMTQVGKWYQYGAAGPNTYDCSGLTMRAWEAAGVSIPRSSRLQYQYVKKIELSQMRPGDLMFWANNPNDPTTIRHVAIYAGNNQFVEAPSTGLQVRLYTMNSARAKDLLPYAGRV